MVYLLQDDPRRNGRAGGKRGEQGQEATRGVGKGGVPYPNGGPLGACTKHLTQSSQPRSKEAGLWSASPTLHQLRAQERPQGQGPRKPVGGSTASTTVPSPGANRHSVIDLLMQSFGDKPTKHLLCPQPHAGCWGNRNKSNPMLALEFSRRTEL